MNTSHRLLAAGASALLAASTAVVSCTPPDRFGSSSATSGGGSGGGSVDVGGVGGATSVTGPAPDGSGPIGPGPTGPGTTGVGGSSPVGSGGGPCNTDAECDDGDLCTDDTCVAGACTYKSNVDDGNACTADSCNPAVGPVHALDGNCCPHSVCSPGVALNNACIFLGKQQEVDCAPKVCDKVPDCCSKGWSQACVDKARSLCVSVASNTISCNCAHAYCKVGPPLDPTCDPCVATVCSYAPGCCMNSWDSNCITQAHQYCNIPLGKNCQ